MAENLTEAIRKLLDKAQGKVVDYAYIRNELQIDQSTPAWENVRKVMERLVVEKIVRPTGQRNGTYKVVTQVKPVSVFGKDRERKPPFRLYFPKDRDTEEEISPAEDIVIREGDIVTIGGVSNFGKTAIALNFCGENIDYGPILMGNEYTTRVEDTDEYEPTPRFLNRLDNMTWVNWTNGTGEDKFTLLPVSDDYAEHVKKDKINIIDWVNLDADKSYGISRLSEDVKAEHGGGITIIVLQKDEFSPRARGGQYTKDFTDCELLIDKYTDTESMITIGKVKEYTRPVMGRTFAFGIEKGVKIINYREIVKCPTCFGKKWKKQGNGSVPCDCMIGYR